MLLILLKVTIKRAVALGNQPLSDHKKSQHEYRSFQVRFDAVCRTLKASLFIATAVIYL